MKNILLLLFFSIFIPPLIYCQAKYWQQQINYTIKVQLNDVEHTLTGEEKMEYCNNSPDTLNFIWIHLWPNAYKNDHTAFSEQMLKNGQTKFYFAEANQQGYINQLNFTVNGTIAKIIDHPLHQDIVQLYLPTPLLPNTKVIIETPFYEKLPFNFSRGGHVGQSYQITQWYPKPAVYDKYGWHQMPYLDQGEFYSEFGDYKVEISLPENYVVASTGQLKNKFIIERQPQPNALATTARPTKNKVFLPHKIIPNSSILSSAKFKTLIFTQEQVHDFAWFAEKGLIEKKDTLQLPSGKIIEINSCYPPVQAEVWKNSINIIKQAILSRSAYLGEYPYQNISAVQAPIGFEGGMEYPAITAISPLKNSVVLEAVLEHEVGHNWNYGILATNERSHPWMDEGINSYYDNRYYNTSKTSNTLNEKKISGNFLNRSLPNNLPAFNAANLYALKIDQPIATAADTFTVLNYNAIAYFKTSEWMKRLENKLGTSVFDSGMHEYYRRWKFKHPYPEDLKNVLEEISQIKLDTIFDLLQKKGSLPLPQPLKKKIKLWPLFNFNKTDKYHYIFIAPAIGANIYDKLMLGILVHNYSLPAAKFQFMVAPMFATGSKAWNGLGRLSYHWLPGLNNQKIELSLSYVTFNTNNFTDSINKTTALRFGKISASVKYDFGTTDPHTTVTKYLQWKTFFIKEQNIVFSRDTIQQKEVIAYPFLGRYVNQLRFVVNDSRALYPYNMELLSEQANGFLRFSLTSNYFFNYAKGGGFNVRFFAGKFLYTVDKTYRQQYKTSAYQLNMSGAQGKEDYTYNNYFTGRNEFDKFSSQQLMNRDGFFKVSTNLLNNKIGKTDDWLMALNFTTSLPSSIDFLERVPIKIPLKFFVDVGTYAAAWQKDAPTGQIIYDAGLQVGLCKNIIQVYLPLFYSRVYHDYYNSIIPQNQLLKKISFSIDIQQFSLKKIFPQIVF